MRIIKLDAIDSTNSYLKKLCLTESVDDYTAVIAENQTEGRGQMGTVWNSETSKNLTFSVFKMLLKPNTKCIFLEKINLQHLKMLKA